ncbi:MAG: hypothetical protein IPK97_13375 [Ahniella sp.]|nr:hypothetical protein [Ahniella sp.]
MSDVQFHETRDGRQFHCVTVPELVRQVTRLNDLLALLIESIDRHAQSSAVNPEDDGERKT